MRTAGRTRPRPIKLPRHRPASVTEHKWIVRRWPLASGCGVFSLYWCSSQLEDSGIWGVGWGPRGSVEQLPLQVSNISRAPFDDRPVAGLHAVTDAFLVYVESDIVTDSHWVLLSEVSEPALLSRSRHCSARENPFPSQPLYIQTDGTSPGPTSAVLGKIVRQINASADVWARLPFERLRPARGRLKGGCSQDCLPHIG
jgi:hypothetical protein